MAITMQDIQNEGFEHSLRGYDVEQVDVFLERVAKEVDAMNGQIAELEEELKTKTLELDAAREQLAAASLSSATTSTVDLEQVSLRDQEASAELDVARERASAEARRAEDAEAKIAALEEQLAEKSKLDSAIAEAFIAAQRSADQIKEDARIEGDRIYQEAEAKAREFIRESLANKAAVENEVKMLRVSAQKFRDEYLEMLDHFMAHAKEEFRNLPELAITDAQISAELPNVESLNVSEFQIGVQKESGESTGDLSESVPRLSKHSIPEINIPTILPNED